MTWLAYKIKMDISESGQQSLLVKLAMLVERKSYRNVRDKIKKKKIETK